jgi:hypothetical protein
MRCLTCFLSSVSPSLRLSVPRPPTPHPVLQGTLVAACNLLAAVGATVVECACMVELKMLGGYKKLQELHPTTQVWGLISEDVLNLEGVEP